MSRHQKQPRILIVDHEEDNTLILEIYLKTISNDIVVCLDPREVEGLFKEHAFDLVFLDTSMPHINGIELCKWIKTDIRYKDVSVIFTTADGTDDTLIAALAAGGLDYIVKPIKKHEIIARAKVAFRLKMGLDEIYKGHANEQANLIKFKHKNKELSKALDTVKNIQSALVFSLSKLAESRDNETGKHLLRTQTYVRLIAEELKTRKEYEKEITETYVEELIEFAPLHDIGKVGIPDEILKKTSRLTYDEFEIMKTHSAIGAETMIEAGRSMGENFLKLAVDIIHFHHEKNDGSGYPKGLKGDEIPLAARIMSIADVYDALRSERYYKKAFDHKKTVDIILNDNGLKFFHKDILDAFVKVSDQFEKVAEALKDK